LAWSPCERRRSLTGRLDWCLSKSDIRQHAWRLAAFSLIVVGSSTRTTASGA